MHGSGDLYPQIMDFLNNPGKLCASNQSFDLPYTTLVITGVHLSAFFGLDHLVRALLLSGHNPNARIAEGHTPLIWAMTRGHEDVVQTFIETPGVDRNSTIRDINWTFHGQRSLMWACSQGCESLVEMLLHSETVDMYATDSPGHDCIWHAARGHQEAVMNLLLSKGKFNPRAQTLCRTFTPAIAQLLLSYDTLNLNEKDDKGFTVLSRGISRCNTALVKFLIIREGIETDQHDRTLQRTLCRAVEYDAREVMNLK